MGYAFFAGLAAHRDGRCGRTLVTVVATGAVYERFSANDIQSLLEATPRYELAESVGPNLSLRALLGTLLSERTRLVSLASPQNPSGVAIRERRLRQILQLMERKCPRAFLLVDETYRDAAYGDDEIAPSALHLHRRVISTASLSKCHGAAGLRLGWAITRDAQLREQLIRGKFNTVISCSAVDEALALKVLKQRDRITGHRRLHLAAGLRRTELWAQQHAAYVDWVKPDAGALCCVRLKKSRFDDQAVERFHAALRVVSAALQQAATP